MARRKKKADRTGSAPWITTFSDLMSLLLTFFILLFSMSSVSDEQFTEAASSLRMALVGDSAESIVDENGDPVDDDAARLNEFEEMDPEDLSVADTAEDSVNAIPEEVHTLYEQVSGYLTEEGVETDLTISRDQDGVYIDIQEAILFDQGSATLKANGSDTIGTLAGLFGLFENEIIIEGYTDDIPIQTRQFDSNWELSVERAVSVLRYLSEEYTINPSRLSARGYGEHRPTVPNDSEDNRAQNRRVNIVIVHNDREEVTSGSEN